MWWKGREREEGGEGEGGRREEREERGWKRMREEAECMLTNLVYK